MSRIENKLKALRGLRYPLSEGVIDTSGYWEVFFCVHCKRVLISVSTERPWKVGMLKKIALGEGAYPAEGTEAYGELQWHPPPYWRFYEIALEGVTNHLRACSDVHNMGDLSAASE